MTKAFVDKATRKDLIFLVRLKDGINGMDAWYYIQVKNKALVPIFLKKVKTGIDLNDFGEILYSGWGKTPPEQIKQEIERRFE